MIRLLFRIAAIIFVVWIIVSVLLGIMSGIANMPYEDGPIDGCNNLKETVQKVKKDVKNSWDECEPMDSLEFETRATGSTARV